MAQSKRDDTLILANDFIESRIKKVKEETKVTKARQHKQARRVKHATIARKFTRKQPNPSQVIQMFNRIPNLIAVRCGAFVYEDSGSKGGTDYHSCNAAKKHTRKLQSTSGSYMCTGLVRCYG